MSDPGDEALFQHGRALRLALAGGALAQGAPLGWLALRWIAAGSPPAAEVARDPALYAYLAVATTVAFAAFGWTIGRYEEHLADANRRLDRLSRSDPLTGLENRRSLTEALPRLISFAHRSRSPLSVIALDLDHFKPLNDEHGHSEGDQVLIRVARALCAGRRREDIVARIGGDEFVVVLPGVPGDGARRVAERILADIRVLRYALGGRPLALTASAGVAELSASDHRSLAFLARADVALYAAKRKGRDRVHSGTPCEKDAP